jgi:hypothetical protein
MKTNLKCFLIGIVIMIFLLGCNNSSHELKVYNDTITGDKWDRVDNIATDTIAQVSIDGINWRTIDSTDIVIRNDTTYIVFYKYLRVKIQ